MPIVPKASKPSLPLEPAATIAWTDPCSQIGNLLAVARASDYAVSLLERNDAASMSVNVGPSGNTTYMIRGLRDQFFRPVTVSELMARISMLNLTAQMQNVARLDKRDPGALASLTDTVVESLRQIAPMNLEAIKGIPLEQLLSAITVTNTNDELWPLINLHAMVYDAQSPFVSSSNINPLGYTVPSFAKLVANVYTPNLNGGGPEADITISALGNMIDSINRELNGGVTDDFAYSFRSNEFFRGLHALGSLDDIRVLENWQTLLAWLEKESSVREGTVAESVSQTDPQARLEALAAAGERDEFKNLLARATRSLALKMFQALKVPFALIRYYSMLLTDPLVPRAIKATRMLALDEPRIREAVEFFKGIRFGPYLESFLNHSAVGAIAGIKLTTTPKDGTLFPSSKLSFITNEHTNADLFAADGLLHKMVELHERLKTFAITTPDLMNSITNDLYVGDSIKFGSGYSTVNSSDADIDYSVWIKRSKSYSGLDAIWKRKVIYLAPFVNLPDQFNLICMRENADLDMFSALATGLPPSRRMTKWSYNELVSMMAAGAYATQGAIDVFPVKRQSQNFLDTLADKSALFKRTAPANYHLTLKDSEGVIYFDSVQTLIHRLRLSGVNPNNIGQIFPYFSFIGKPNSAGAWELHDNLVYSGPDVETYFTHNFVQFSKFNSDVHVACWYNNNALAWMDDNWEEHAVIAPPGLQEYRDLVSKMSISLSQQSDFDKLKFTDKIIFS